VTPRSTNMAESHSLRNRAPTELLRNMRLQNQNLPTSLTLNTYFFFNFKGGFLNFSIKSVHARLTEMKPETKKSRNRHQKIFRKSARAGLNRNYLENSILGYFVCKWLMYYRGLPLRRNHFSILTPQSFLI
jgi:hypothetical protein